MAGSCACDLGAACGSRGGQKEPCPQTPGICARMADCYFWSQRSRQMRQVATVVVPHLLSQDPTLPDGQCSLPLHFFFPFRNQTLKTRTLKNNCEYEEDQEVIMNAKDKAQKRPEKTWSLHLRLTLGTETAYKMMTTAQGRGRIKSYCIIQFKYPVFDKKNPPGIQRNRKLKGPLKGKNINRNCLWKWPDSRYTRQRL